MTVKAHAPKSGGKFEILDQVDIPRNCKWPARKPVGKGASSAADPEEVRYEADTEGVLYRYIRNPWRERIIMVGGLALLPSRWSARP